LLARLALQHGEEVMKPSPAPWKWQEVDSPKTVEAWSLQCADDTYVAIPNTDETISLRSEDDKALIALAPEMRTMLLKFDYFHGSNSANCPWCGKMNAIHTSCVFSALLEKLR
jgi:hypothetical protein